MLAPSDDRDAAVRDERPGVVAEQLVLGRAGQGDVARARPTGVSPAWKVAPLNSSAYSLIRPRRWVLCALTQSIFSWVDARRDRG